MLHPLRPAFFFFHFPITEIKATNFGSSSQIHTLWSSRMESDSTVSTPAASGQDGNSQTPSGISSWRLKIPQLFAAPRESSQTENAGMSVLARFTNGFGSQMPSATSQSDEGVKETEQGPQSGLVGSFKKGLVDSSRSVMNAVQVKARHMVSQNKRRYMEGGFDLDMTYITDNIIAMGFPAGSMSSGLFGYIEGFYRNHMEEVIKFFETHHQGKYIVYNLCSERLYDGSLFGGKVATFPFDDHNCPPIELIMSFCQSAYAWLKEDIQNVVAIHCKAGMARTGLMICSLLLYLKFFPTAEEAMDYYNQKRCVDAKALVLPSQIRYVKYFECILQKYNGENQPGRRCMLRGFRLHKCPNWIRPSITISNHKGILFSTKKHPKTKDLMPEDFWIKSPKTGILVFALPGEPGLTELSGDFKIHFHDSQGDFYCWLNTTMTENRKILDASDLDRFDKRKLPSLGFQIEIVMIDYDGTLPKKSKTDSSSKKSEGSSCYGPGSSDKAEATSNKNKASKSEGNDDLFSDSDEDETGHIKRTPVEFVHIGKPTRSDPSSTSKQEIGASAHETDRLSLRSEKQPGINTSQKSSTDGAGKPASSNEASTLESAGTNDIKAIAADASVFTFVDEEDFESD